MDHSFFFTVFIPTYNRAHTLPRLFDSLERQSYTNFEIIIVDDGSTDNTKKIVKEYIKYSNHKIKYFYQKNSGKHIARNLGVKHASGKFFNTVDSDDILTNDSLQLMYEYWNQIEGSKEDYAGIIGLCAYLDSKELIGDAFPQNMMDINHVIFNEIYKIKGDKTQCIKTQIMIEYPFPNLDKEKYIAESSVWNKIGLKYKFKCVNHILKYVEYLSDGLSANNIQLRVKNSKGSVLYYKEYVNEILPHYKIRFFVRYKAYINYIRFSFHDSIKIKKQLLKIKSKVIYLMAFPIGLLMYLRDFKKIQKVS